MFACGRETTFSSKMRESPAKCGRLDRFELVGPTFRKCNDIVITSLIACDCVVIFSLAIMAVKKFFKALVMVELLDSEEEEENKGPGMTRSWLKKREELGYFYKHCTRIAIGRY